MPRQYKRTYIPYVAIQLNKLRNLRKESEYKFAKALGMHRTHLRRLENEVENPRKNTILAIIKKLNNLCDLDLLKSEHILSDLGRLTDFEKSQIKADNPKIIIVEGDLDTLLVESGVSGKTDSL